MKEENGYFSSFDGTKLFYRAWQSGSPNVLILVHGFGEHSGRFDGLVQSLRPLPISCFIHDLRGHGRSEGPRMYVERFRDFVEDLVRFRNFIGTQFGIRAPETCSLYGQSMGALIAVHAVLEHAPEWRSLALVSPYFALPVCHGLLSTLAEILNLIAPRMIWDNPIKPSYLTHDSEVVGRYLEDPFVQRRTTARLAVEMFRAGDEAFKRAEEVKVPLLMLAAGDDRIVSLNQAKVFFSRVRSTKKKLEVFDGFYHELIHETERIKPITALREYLIHLGL
jgi:alpha-beta hydrolase superfamily lysophospholipase